MYVEVIVDRPIIKPNRRSFVETPEDANVRYPEVEAIEAEDGSVPTGQNPLATTFHYHIPKHLLGQLQPGHLVAVPFRTQQLPAIVVRLSNTAPVEITRPIIAILDPLPVVTPAQLRLAGWLSYEYLAPLSTCLRYFLPPGSSRKPEWWLRPTAEALSQVEILDAPAQILLTYLRQHKAVPLSEVQANVAETLIEKGLAYKEARLGKPRVGPKMDRTVELLIAPDEVEAILPTLGRTSKQADLLLHLIDSDDPLPVLDEVLAAVGCSKGPAEALAQKGWVEIIPAKTLLSVPPSVKRAGLKLKIPIPNEGQAVFDYLCQQSQPISLPDLLAATGTQRAVINFLSRKILWPVLTSQPVSPSLWT